MKIAILIAGRILHFEKHYKNIIENIVQTNEVDFFLSHSPELGEDVESFRELYKPKTLNNDEIIPRYIDEKYKHVNRHNCTRMLYNRQRVFNDFKEYSMNHNIHYDLIINYRIDTFAFNKLDYNWFNNSNENNIYIPLGEDNGIPNLSINDQMAFGNINVMEKYFSIYNNIIEYLQEGCRFVGEDLVWHCIKKNNMNIIRLNHKQGIVR